MTTPTFAPTHEVAGTGASTWDVPEPNRPPAHHLEAGLPVELLEETGGWGRVRCHNGWETWVDARALAPVELPAFAPAFATPDGGLDAYATPDASRGVGTWLEAGLPVEIVAARGEWVRVRCSTGWEGWVGGRALVSFPATSTRVDAAPADVEPLQSSALLLPIVGAVLVTVGAALPWFGRPGPSAWDVRLVSLFTHQPTDVAVDAGPVLLVVWLVALALFTRRPLPSAAVASLALVVLVVGGAALWWLLDADTSPGVGVGLGVTLAGGLVVGAGAVARR